MPPISPLERTKRGSLYLTRPTLFHYIAKPSSLARGASSLFEIVASGKAKLRIGQTYPLADAAQARRDLEARQTTGGTLPIPRAVAVSASPRHQRGPARIVVQYLQEG